MMFTENVFEFAFRFICHMFNIEEMLKDQGQAITDITSIYLGNVKEFYTDNTWKYVDSKYEKNLVFTLTEGGIKMSYSHEGKDKITESMFFPYASINWMKVRKAHFTVYLKN